MPPFYYLPNSLRQRGRPAGSAFSEGSRVGAPSGARLCSARTALRPRITCSFDAQESPASARICSSILANLALSTPPKAAASYLMPSRTKPRSSGSLPTLHFFGDQGVLALLLQLQLGHGRAVDLVGAVGQSQGAGGSPKVGEREVVRDSRPAEGLDGPVQNPQGRVRGDELYHGDLCLRLLVAHRVHHVGGLQRQEPGLLDLHPRVGDPLHDHTLLSERLAERLALFDPLAHQLDRPLGDPDEAHAVVDTARAQATLRDG